MKRLMYGVGLALGVAFFLVSPAAACEQCNYHGFVCSSWGCWDVYHCDTVVGPCTQCFDNCIENDGFYCTLSLPCQWTAKPIEGDRLASIPPGASLLAALAL